MQNISVALALQQRRRAVRCVRFCSGRNSNCGRRFRRSDVSDDSHVDRKPHCAARPRALHGLEEAVSKAFNNARKRHLGLNPSDAADGVDGADQDVVEVSVTQQSARVANHPACYRPYLEKGEKARRQA